MSAHLSSPATDAPPPPGRAPIAGRSDAPRWRELLAQPAVSAFAVLVVCVLVASQLSSAFLDLASLSAATSRYVEIGLLALAMTIVVVNGDIDLSVGSTMACSAATLALLHDGGAPLGLACLAAVALGALLGAFNGFVVTRFALPSLVVTLGTMALFRGAAEVLMGDRAIANYPESFVGLDQRVLFGTEVDLNYPFLIFLVLAVAFWLLLHRTSFGRFCFAIGTNPVATRYAGVRVERMRLTAFVLSGLMAGIAAVLITSRLGSTRSDLGLGIELTVITVVVLGGTDIFGGRGSILATVLALFSVIALQEGMALANVNGQTQSAVIGGVLIASILVPNVVRSINNTRRRAS